MSCILKNFKPEFGVISEVWEERFSPTFNTAPPPYNQHPVYSNTSHLGESDPFDTSTIYPPTSQQLQQTQQSLHRYYSHVSPEHHAVTRSESQNIAMQPQPQQMTSYTSQTTSHTPQTNSHLQSVPHPSQTSSYSPQTASHIPQTTSSSYQIKTSPSKRQPEPQYAEYLSNSLQNNHSNITPLQNNRTSSIYSNHQIQSISCEFLTTNLLKEPLKTESLASNMKAMNIVEFEKQLGKREATANMSASASDHLSLDPLSPSYSATSSAIPVLQPPPQSYRVRQPVKNTNIQQPLPKVQNDTQQNASLASNARLYDDPSETTNVFNKMWYESAVKDNVYLQNKQTNTSYCDTVSGGWKETSFGEFKCNQQQSFPKYDLSQHGNPVPVLPQARLYGDSRLYDGNVYSEVSDNVYSQVEEDILRPHRPAPPSPLVFGVHPQSMQQIQRRLQTQGQVGCFLDSIT